MRTFDPWVGSKYRAEGLAGTRVLILGESHYGEPGSECATYTIDVVRTWAQAKRNRFFTVTHKLVSGYPPGSWVPDSERIEFWERVAFYNYVQSLTGPAPRYRPTERMWEDAAPIFLHTVRELEPHVVVMLGLELHDRAPAVSPPVRVCGVQHPSSAGFTYAEWQPLVKAVIEGVRVGT